ncbi:hypothetical protein [Halobacterium wangiae]|uniref:hypothetical protein n=1 Tax=Halobacterium wangiae TaxID=2902623 RepID=UPI001E4A047C|nr:hypothetical protein [Halobacterium wangiae]
MTDGEEHTPPSLGQARAIAAARGESVGPLRTHCGCGCGTGTVHTATGDEEHDPGADTESEADRAASTANDSDQQTTTSMNDDEHEHEHEHTHNDYGEHDGEHAVDQTDEDDEEVRVFKSAAEREAAVAALKEDGTEIPEKEKGVFLSAHVVGWRPEECDCIDALCYHAAARVRGVDPEVVRRENETAVDADPRYIYDGGEEADPTTNADVATGTRSSWAARKEAEADDEQRVNYAAVPGPFSRSNAAGDDEDDWPAGGRSAWERKQAGLPQEPDEEVPVGGRSAYEARATLVEQRYPLLVARYAEAEEERRNAVARKKGKSD